MLWLRVTKEGKIFVYREFPDMSLGEWALASDKPDGKEGVAQRNGAGMGLDEIKATIRKLEGEEEIAERYIDPRAGATQAIGKDGGTSLMELLDDGDDPMYFAPAAGVAIEQGVAIINDWFSYDLSQPLSPINEPRLFISDKCQNLIYCLKEWTGADGEKGATKDPIDCLRYLSVMSPVHIGNDYTPIGKPFIY
jgi:hypothetical protein